MAAEQPVDTRGRLLSLLCAGDRTVAELARELGITGNATRTQLRQLERDGLVAHRVVRRGVGKPPHEYRLTDRGSLHLSRAYLPLVRALLEVVSEDLEAAEQEALLRATGRAVARGYPSARGGLAQRLDMALEVLEDLGAEVRMREEEGRVTVEGACCPVRALVGAHPVACKCVEAMLAEIVGVPVRERCRKESPPSCRLEVAVAPTGREPDR